MMPSYVLQVNSGKKKIKLIFYNNFKKMKAEGIFPGSFNETNISITHKSTIGKQMTR